MLKEFDQENFKEIIDTNQTVIFFFHKDNCIRCKTLENQIKSYLETNDLLVYSINAEKHMNLLRKNNIYAIPAILLYKNQELVYRNLGYIDFNDVVTKLK